MGSKKLLRGKTRYIICFLVIALLVGVCGTVIHIWKNREVPVWQNVSDEEISYLLSFLDSTILDDENVIGCDGSDFTYKDVKGLLQALNLEEYVEYDHKLPFLSIKREDWMNIYDQILDYLNMAEDITICDILVLRVSEESITTSEGDFLYEGHTLEPYQCYRVYVKNENIIGVRGQSEAELSIPNVYIKNSDTSLEYLYQYEEYSYDTQEAKDVAGCVCNLYFQHGQLTRIEKMQETITGKLLTLENDVIEIEGYGKVACTPDLPVYQTYGEIKQKNRSDIVIGNMTVSYMVADKKICAILLTDAPVMDSVRVLLLEDGQNPTRSDIYISSDKGMKIHMGEKEEQYEANTVFTVSTYAWDGDYLTVEPVENGSMYISDSVGTIQSLPYEGRFEIRKIDNGYAIVNVLGLEDYLCKVVCSEMPYNYPLDALKVQAICARSYAIRQIYNTSYIRYGAHMDDTVNFQVYNKQQGNDATTQAVKETAGMVLTYKENVVEAYYYSTSFGHSGSTSSWNLPQDGSYDYLSEEWQRETPLDIDLSSEEAFAEYISGDDEECYDSFSQCFRWDAVLSIKGQEEELYDVIMRRKDAREDCLTIKINSTSELENDKVTKADVCKLGNLCEIRILERNSCGGVANLLLEFENGQVQVREEYTMRQLLGKLMTSVTWKNGVKKEGSGVLSSCYFTIVSRNGEELTLRGGGYGHGIGMCQNGAKGMADLGYDYLAILNHFYHGATLSNIYEQTGGFEEA